LKIPYKYGLLITVCFILWVVIAHLLVPDPTSAIHRAGAGTFVNIVEVIMIALGIRARKVANGNHLRFKDGLKTGVGIAAVYGITASLFFAIILPVIGKGMLAAEPGAEMKPAWQVALGAFIGLGLGAVLFGLLYSVIISFILASRRSDERT